MIEIEKEYVKCDLCNADNTKVLFLAKDRGLLKEGIFNVVQCRGCGLVYVNPRPTRKGMKYYYPPDYGPYQKINYDNVGIMGKSKGKIAGLKNWVKRTILEEYYGYHSKNIGGRGKSKVLKKILVFPFLPKYKNMYYWTIPFFEQGKVLDIGCGNASYLAWLKQLGWEPYGVEIDEACVKFAKQEYGIDVFCGDLLEAKFPSNFFDCITMWHFLEHSSSPLLSLKESYRVMKQNSLLVICVPNIGSLEAKIFKSCWYPLDIPRHLYDFSGHTLRQLLGKAGFKIKRISYSDKVDTLLWDIEYLLKENGYAKKISARWRMNLMLKSVGKLLAFTHQSSVITCYATKG